MERGIKAGLLTGGVFTMRHFVPDDRELAHFYRMWYGVDSPQYKSIKRHLVATVQSHNLITTEGVQRIMDVMFNGTTQIATWYVAIFNTNTTILASHTYDVPGYTEDTDYDEATRPAYVEAACTAGGVTTNAASPAVFTIATGGQTIYGASLVSVSTKGDHTGGANNVLFSACKFGTARAVLADDVLNVTYQLTEADDGV